MSLFTLASNNNTNVMARKFQKFVGQFTPIKWSVPHNLVRMKTIVNYRNCMLVVLVVFFLITINGKYSEIFVYDDFSSKKSPKLYIADTL